VPGLKELSCGKNPKEIPPPVLNSTIKNTPNVAGLSPDCAKIVWYNLALQNPFPANFVHPFPADTLVVTFKQHISKEKAMKIIYSPEAKGTFYSEGEDEMWDNFAGQKAYAGRWNYTQMCHFEHLPEVSHVGLVGVIVGLYGISLPGFAW
jgi:hypothetical protein